MAKVVLAARILLGIVFVFFGLNIILQFLKMPPPPGDAGQFMTILAVHGFMRVVGLLQIVAGILLLVGRYVPLALMILAPIIVNILMFHLFLLGGTGIAPGLVVTVLELFLLWAYRLSFRGLFDASPEGGLRGAL